MRRYFIESPYSESLLRTSNHTPACPRTLTLTEGIKRRMATSAQEPVARVGGLSCTDLSGIVHRSQADFARASINPLNNSLMPMWFGVAWRWQVP
jgi:hypothetical protein